jgi:hypothetical protein
LMRRGVKSAPFTANRGMFAALCTETLFAYTTLHAE